MGGTGGRGQWGGGGGGGGDRRGRHVNGDRWVGHVGGTGGRTGGGRRLREGTGDYSLTPPSLTHYWPLQALHLCLVLQVLNPVDSIGLQEETLETCVALKAFNLGKPYRGGHSHGAVSVCNVCACMCMYTHTNVWCVPLTYVRMYVHTLEVEVKDVIQLWGGIQL